MSYFLDPTKTLRLDPNWLRKHVTKTAFDYEDLVNATEIKCQLSSREPDHKFMSAVKRGQVGLMLPLRPTDLFTVTHSWMRCFLAIAAQQKLNVARLKVGDYRTSQVLVRVGRKSKRVFKVMLESPLNVPKGIVYMPDFLETLEFSALEDTGLLFCKLKKVYCILYDDYVLMTGQVGALKNLKKDLVKNFVVEEVSSSFTFEGMHVVPTDQSIRIDCDEAIKEFFVAYSCSIEIPDMSAEYPVLREDVEVALQIEEADEPGELSESARELSEPLGQVESWRFWLLLDELKDIGNCGRMDISAVCAYLALSTKAPRRIYWKMLQQLCRYLRSGPPYCLKYEYQPDAEVNLSATTRWFPLPIEVYAWFYGDCPVTWKATYEPSATFHSVSRFPSVLLEGGCLSETISELGLAPSPTWEQEFATQLYDLFYRPQRPPSTINVLSARRGEPFTFAKPEDADIDLGRTSEQSHAESERRVPIVRWNEGHRKPRK